MVPHEFVEKTGTSKFRAITRLETLATQAKLDLDQDQQYRITLKTEDKAD